MPPVAYTTVSTCREGAATAGWLQSDTGTDTVTDTDAG
jgi:hypothetical protein